MTDEPRLQTQPRGGVPDVTDTLEGFREVCDRLAGAAGPLAADAERASGFRYGHEDWLVQFKREGAGIVLLDPVALTRAGAERRGLTVRETSLTEDYRPDFMLTTTPVTSILTWDPETRKVKGGQFCSKADISGAANVISMAIQAGFTIDQLANVDFLFQPNFDKPVYYVGAVAMKAAAE